MSVNNNQQRTIDGQNTLFCDTIEINEEIILGGDNGLENYVIKSDGVNARWAALTSLLVAGTGINLSGNTISASNVPNSALQNSTISGVSLGSNLNSLTAGSNIAMASLDGVETEYNGTKAITIASANTEYTAGSGLSLSAGNEFSLTNNTISGKTLGSNLDNLTAGTNISFSSGSTYNGSSAITISSTDTNTEYTAGTGLSLSVGNEFSINLTEGTGISISGAEISIVLQEGTGITIADDGFGNPAISLTNNTISGIPLGNTLGELRITTGGGASTYDGSSNIAINLDNNYTPLRVPTSSTGLPRGALFNNSGTAAFVP
jgi:hypothetical protein